MARDYLFLSLIVCGRWKLDSVMLACWRGLGFCGPVFGETRSLYPRVEENALMPFAGVFPLDNKVCSCLTELQSIGMTAYRYLHSDTVHSSIQPDAISSSHHQNQMNLSADMDASKVKWCNQNM